MSATCRREWRPGPAPGATPGARVGSQLKRPESPVSAEDKRIHFLECRTCGQDFDMRDLGQVFFHEHEGIGDTPGLDQVGPGRRVEGAEGE